jgi:hypothetical protein
VGHVKTIGALIDLHIADMKDIGKALGRSNAYSLDLLKDRLSEIPSKISTGSGLSRTIISRTARWTRRIYAGIARTTVG